MTIENEIKRLKAISDAAANTRDIARKAYDKARNAGIGSYNILDDSVTRNTRNAYNNAAWAATAAWDAYIAKKQETTVNENKRIAISKMNELKIAAWNARSAELGAAKSRDDAWAIYIEAVDAFNAAKVFSEETRKESDDYEATDYEAPDYTPVG